MEGLSAGVELDRMAPVLDVGTRVARRAARFGTGAAREEQTSRCHAEQSEAAKLSATHA